MSKLNRYSCYIAFISLLFSLSIFGLNSFYYHFQGIEYVSWITIVLMFVNLSLIWIGLKLLLDPAHQFLFIVIKRFSLLFGLLCLMAIFTSAIQLTPFPPIDKTLLSIEHFIHSDSRLYLQFIYQHPQLLEILKYVYSFLDLEICSALLLMVIFYDPNSQSEFIFLLLSTCLVGFTFYYFFPTTAPASVIENKLFMQVQRSTFLKFYEVHHNIPGTTLAGGLIAMPSFHAIWAILCQYYFFRWPWIALFLLPINILILISCVMLGWHYLVDIIASFIICTPLIYFSHTRIKSDENALLKKNSTANKKAL